jgi:pectate lyase-like protein
MKRRKVLAAIAAGTAGAALMRSPTTAASVPISHNVKDYGAVGDGVIDDIAAFEAAHAAVKSIVGGWVVGGGTILIPKGKYRLSRTWNITCQCVVQGAGGWGWSPSTELIFDAGQTGIHMIDDYVPNPIVDRADWASLRDFRVKAAGKTTAVDGILVNAITNLMNIGVDGFKRHGISVYGAVPGNNATESSFQNIRVDNCDGDGLHVEGNDANACTFVAVTCSNNGGWGIWDGSFLGNTYIGAHVENNLTGAIHTEDDTSDTTFIGTYVEGGQGVGVDLRGPALMLGGNGASAVQSSAAVTGVGMNVADTRLFCFGRFTIRPYYDTAEIFFQNNGAVSDTARVGQGTAGSDHNLYLDVGAGYDVILRANNNQEKFRANAGGILVSGYEDLTEITAPAGPAGSTTRLYAKDKAGVTELFYKNDLGVERDLSACRQTIDGWYQDNVASSQAAVVLLRSAATGIAGSFVMPRSGSITGIVVKSTAARTNGTLTVEVYKAGSSTGLTAVLNGTNATFKATTQAKDLNTFVAGDELDVRITTDGRWAPTTAGIRASIEIES